MTRTLGSILIAIAVTALIAGCAAKNKFAGTWEASQAQANITITFTDSGTFSQTTAASGGMLGDVKIDVSGTYKVDGDKLTFTPNEMKMNGLPEQFKGMAEKQFESQKGKPQTNPVTWNGNDEFSLSTPNPTGGTASAVFKRKK